MTKLPRWQTAAASITQLTTA